MLTFDVGPSEQVVSLKIASVSGEELLYRFYTPSGELWGGASTTLRLNPVYRFDATEPGVWRLEVQRRSPSPASVTYVISGFQQGPIWLPEKPAPVDELESPRLRSSDRPPTSRRFGGTFKPRARH